MPCDRGLEADALDLELLLEALVGALDVVGDERAGEPVQRLVLARAAGVLDVERLAVERGLDAGGQTVRELAARPLDVDLRAGDGDLHLVGNENGLETNAGHERVL